MVPATRFPSIAFVPRDQTLFAAAAVRTPVPEGNGRYGHRGP